MPPSDNRFRGFLNIKLIFISFFILGIVLGGLYFVFLKNNSQFKKVLGTDSKKTESSSPQSNTLQEKLDILKKQVNNLNVSDLATSSPQVQKIIQDLQTLRDLPKNQLKDACFNVCRGL